MQASSSPSPPPPSSPAIPDNTAIPPLSLLPADTSPPLPPAPQHDALLTVRVLSCREFATRKCNAHVVVRLGELAKATHVVEVPHQQGTVTVFNEELVFLVPKSQMSVREEACLEISLVTVARNMTGTKTKTILSTFLVAGATADSGSPDTAAWIPFPNSPAATKISLFWQKITEEDNNISPIPSSPSSPRRLTSRASSAATTSANIVTRTSLTRARKPYVSASQVVWIPDVQYAAAGSSRPSLQVTIHQCKDLLAVNMTNRSSDPYVAVSIRGTRRKTKIYQGNLNPVFQETFTFGDVEDLDDEDEITLVVMDWNRIGKNTEMGCVSFNLRDVARDVEMFSRPRWYRLDSTLNQDWGPTTELGWIQLEIKYKPSAFSSLRRAPSDFLAGPTDSSSPTLSLTNNNKSVPNVDMAANSSNTESSSSFCKPRPKLFVRVIQARNLLAADADGKSDPYVVVRLGVEEKRTITRRKTLCPVWDAEFAFGMASFLTIQDVVTISVVDWDPGLVGDLADDALGELHLPIWSLLHDNHGEPKWYALKSLNDETTGDALGEIQLAFRWSDPDPDDKKPDIYKGKVWHYDLQVTLLEAKDLMIRDVQTKSSDPFCILSCGAEQYKSEIVMRNRNPIWNQRFRFRKRKSVHKNGEEPTGLGRTDTLRVDVRDYDGPGMPTEAMGSVDIDMAWLIDKLGYIDPSGKSLTMEFPLKGPSDVIDAVQQQHQHVPAMNDDDALPHELLDNTPPSTPPQPSSTSKTTLMARFAASGSKALTRLGVARVTSITSTPPPPAPTTLSPIVGSMAAPVQFDPATSTTATQPDTFGRIKLRLRLTPIGESRHAKKSKLILRLGQCSAIRNVGGPVEDFTSEGDNASSSSFVPCTSFVHAVVKVGFDVQQTAPVPAKWYVGGRPSFNSTLLFVDGIDYKLSKAAELRKQRDRDALRTKQSGGGSSTINTDGDPDAVRISICDETGNTLCTFSSTLSQLLASSEQTVTTTTANSGTVKLQLAAVMDQSKEELVPLLGHINLRLLSLKLKDKKLTFKETIKGVVKYGGKRQTTRVHLHDPSPTFAADEGIFQFPVYNPHDVVVVEIWDTSGTGGILSSKLDMVKSLAGRVFGSSGGSNKTPTQQPSPDGTEEETNKKSGIMLGSLSLSLFDIYELEAQVVFGNDAVLTRPSELACKLPIRDRHGKTKATIWLEAAYDENTWGVLASNPNPPVLKGKSYSLTHFRHEINRLVSIVGWLSAFGARVSRLMNWQSTPNTIAVLVIITIFCTVDWLSSRFLILIPLCLIMHIINRNTIRRNGEFLGQFEDDDRDEDIRAELRIACVETSFLKDVPDLTKVVAKVHLIPSIKDPSKKPLHVGSTLNAPVAILEDNVPYADLAAFARGYTICTAGSSVGCTLQSWKYDVEELPVPCFDFRMPNEVVNEALLVIVVHEARGIMAADASGKSDPFIKIAVNPETGGETFKTAIINQTLEPVWNQEFVAGGKIPIVASGTVSFHLFDDDGMMKSSDPLGSVILQLPSMDGGGRHDVIEDGSISHHRGGGGALGDAAHVVWQAGMDVMQRVGGGMNNNNSGGNVGPVKVPSSNPTWYKIIPPPGAGENETEFGELCISMKWLDTGMVPKSTYRAHKDDDDEGAASAAAEDGNGDGSSATGGGDDDQTGHGSGTSGWTRSAVYTAVDLYEVSHTPKQRFLGRARIPTASLIISEDYQEQPIVDTWVGLDYKNDGSVDDAQLHASGGPRGEVHVVAMVTLPDPKLEEKRLAMNEAKRTEKLNPIQKLFVIERKLKPVQEMLFQINNRLERLKNLFNWTHPRRTQWMLNLMLILVAIFMFIPSRFFILMTVLFFFTERFRPMGTMGARFKHLLSQLPTDDELKRMVKDEIIAVAKRRSTMSLSMSSKTVLKEQQGGGGGDGRTTSRVLRSSGRSNNVRSPTPTAAQQQQQTRPISDAGDSLEPVHHHMVVDESVLRINLTEALFSGHMFFAHGHSDSIDSTKHMVRKFFACSKYGLHFWPDQDAAESDKDSSHIANIKEVWSERKYGQDLLFVVTTHDGERFVFACSSVSKRDIWVNVIKTNCVVVEPYVFEKSKKRRGGGGGGSGGGGSGSASKFTLRGLPGKMLASIGSSAASGGGGGGGGDTE